MVEKAGIAILIDDEEGNIKYANQKAAELYGYSQKEMNDQSVKSLVHPDDFERVMKFHKARIQRKKAPSSYVFKSVRKNGAVRYFELIAAPDKKEETVIGTRSYLKDVTEQKRAEEQMKTSLKEKEVLLQEIHHRVKNNMQLISSILNLQSGVIKNKRVLELFKSSQNRIKSMALIHEKLYKSKDFTRIDFSKYVQSLSKDLFRVYGINQDVVKLNIDIKDLLLNINTAIPCGLIINELISNALKYAFPDGKKGKIKIAMSSLNNNKMELTVSDNGIGIPEEVDIRGTKSLGLHLVTILAEDQLQGEIKLARTKGTKFNMILRKKK